MSAADRSSMYKAKYNRSRQNADISEKTRIRRDKRLNQYNDNRIIPQSPEKTSEQPTQVKRNRQQEFRERFENYLKKKAELKLKSKPKPFIPACVAKGTCFESIAPAVRTSPKKKSKQSPTELKDLMLKDSKVDKPSGNGFTVNTYERPFVFTRSRAKAEALKADTKPTAEKVVKTKPAVFKKTQPEIAATAPKIVKPTTSKIVKKTDTKTVAVKPTLKPNVKPTTSKTVKKTETKTSKPAASKTPQPKNSIKNGKQQTNEKNERLSVVTSTVVKPKKHSSTNENENIFDQSFSPIETKTDDAPANVQQVAELKQQNNPGNMFFVSPCVKLMKGKLNSTSNKEKVTPKTIKTPEAGSSGSDGASYLSPFVTISRGGRTSSRKEKKARESKYVLESRKSLLFNESIEDRQKTEAAAYFRSQVKQQTDRYNEIIATWQEIIKEGGASIPTECVDSINVAIGQTQLLTTSKFKQFSNLVTKFEKGEGEQTILAEDLEGFSSMVYIQVEDCNKRFERLEILKKNDWEDPELKVVKQKKLLEQNNGMVTKQKKTGAKVNAAFAKMLLEARNNMKAAKNKALEVRSDETVLTPTSKKLKGRLSSVRKNATPSKTPCIVEDTTPKMTPVRSILKTPASSRKQMRITFKTSPQVKLFEKENNTPEKVRKSS